jgi:hypothetical protein
LPVTRNRALPGSSLATVSTPGSLS